MLKTDAHPWESVFVLHIMKASSMRRIRFLTIAKMYPFFCPEVVVFVVLSVVKCVVEAWGHDFSPGPHFYGTGSYPLPPQGWQRSILFSDSQNPLKGPYFRKASSAYWEQVGVKRQQDGLRGDMQI